MASYEIVLDERMEVFVNEMVEKGRYDSVNQAVMAALVLLEEKERSLPGRKVEIPNNPSLSSLNTFLDDNLQDLISMLDEQEAKKNRDPE